MIQEISKHEFESKLPVNFHTKQPMCELWRYMKYNDSHVYKMKVAGTNSYIYIDSTIGINGFANTSNSRGIKIWSPCVSFCGVLPSHLKRTLGWNHRLEIYLRFAYLSVLNHHHFTYQRNERLHEMADYIIKRKFRRDFKC